MPSLIEEVKLLFFLKYEFQKPKKMNWDLDGTNQFFSCLEVGV